MNSGSGRVADRALRDIQFRRQPRHARQVTTPSFLADALAQVPATRSGREIRGISGMAKTYILMTQVAKYHAKDD